MKVDVMFIPKPQNPVGLQIKSAVLWLEEGVSECFGSEEGFGEVVVVLRCPVVSLSVVTLSIILALWCVADRTVSVAYPRI